MFGAIEQTIKLTLLSTTVLFGVIFMGLAAASRNGDGIFMSQNSSSSKGTRYLDTLAAFSILGALLSMFTGGAGMYLALKNVPRKSLLGRIWTAFSLLTVFFLSCAFGAWAVLQSYIESYSEASLELACLAFNILLVIAWIGTLLYTVYAENSAAEQVSATYDQVPDEESGKYGGGYDDSSSGSFSGSALGRIDVGLGSGFDLSSLVLTVAALFCLITLALAAANKNGDDDNIETPDAHAGLAITGALVGMMTSVGGVLLRLLNIENSMVSFAWLSSTMIAFWFIAAPFGSYAAINGWMSGYSLLQAEMAFEFLSTLLLSMAIFLRFD